MKISFVTLLLLTGIFLLNSCSSENQSSTSEEDTARKEEKLDLSTTSPPIAGINIEEKRVEINPKKGGEIELENGGFINIPENAFLDEYGEIVTTPVEIIYREFNDPTDFIVSGIPMTLELKDTECKIFSSAGMIEINAESEGKKLKPNPENQIQIAMASNTAGDSPLWKFEEGIGWKEIGQPENFNAKKLDSLQNLKWPEEPKLANPSIGVFHVTENLVAKKPNLKKYLGMSFSPTSDDCYYMGDDASFLRDVNIKSNRGGTYTISITQHYKEPIECEFIRVYNQKAYEKKIAEYNRVWGDYYRKNKTILDKIAIIKERMTLKGAGILNSFPVTEFGILNCDQALRQEFANNTFSINGEKSDPSYVLYCLDYSRNAKYPCTSGQKIGIEASSDYALFASGINGEVLYASKSECKNFLKGQHFDIQLKSLPIDIPVKELSELMEK